MLDAEVLLSALQATDLPLLIRDHADAVLFSNLASTAPHLEPSQISSLKESDGFAVHTKPWTANQSQHGSITWLERTNSAYRATHPELSTQDKQLIALQNEANTYNHLLSSMWVLLSQRRLDEV